MLKKISIGLVALVAIEHVYIMILEMFLWTKPAGLRAFGFTPEFAEQTTVLAANQGLYNGFLAAGLVWSLLSNAHGYALKVFFLLCVVIAGVFGAITAKPSIFFIQAVPAIVALVATLLVQRSR